MKKTLALALVFAVVASVCCVLFVSAEGNDLAEYKAEYAALAGTPLEAPDFTLDMSAEVDEDGWVSLYITVADIPADKVASLLMAQLHYDTEKLELVTEKDSSGAYDIIYDAPTHVGYAFTCDECGEENVVETNEAPNKCAECKARKCFSTESKPVDICVWESLSKDVSEGVITLDVCVADAPDYATAENKVTLLVEFELINGATYGGFYVTTDSIELSHMEEINDETVEYVYLASGVSAVAAMPVEDESSVPDETTEDTTTEDTTTEDTTTEDTTTEDTTTEDTTTEEPEETTDDTTTDDTTTEDTTTEEPEETTTEDTTTEDTTTEDVTTEAPASSEEESKPATGDAGIVVFVVLALVAAVGTAVAVRVRH